MRMLKPFLMALCLFLSSRAMAQQYQLDSVVHSINDMQFISSQKYYPESNKAELVRYKLQRVGGAIQKTERSEVVYNDKGSELCHVFSVWNPIGNTWNEEEKTEQEFNTDNKLVSLSSYRKSNDQWLKVFENKRLYVQDSIIETDYETKDDKFQATHKTISVINAFDKVKTHEIFLWSDKNQTWKPLIRTTNTYQNDTTMIGFETEEWKDSQWQKQEKVVYELSNGSLPTANYILYKGQNNQWMPLTKFEEESFHEQNKKISVTYKWQETHNKWIIQAKVETYSNENGKKQDVLFSELDTSSNQLKLQLEQMHLYDQDGRLTLLQEFYFSNEIRTGTQNTVKFDKEGDVIQENMYEFDSQNNTWNVKTTTEFLYDKNIELSMQLEGRKNNDLFKLNVYNTNKHAIKQVKIYSYQNGKKILSEEFEYFYSVAD